MHEEKERKKNKIEVFMFAFQFLYDLAEILWNFLQ